LILLAFAAVALADVEIGYTEKMNTIQINEPARTDFCYLSDNNVFTGMNTFLGNTTFYNVTIKNVSVVNINGSISINGTSLDNIYIRNNTQEAYILNATKANITEGWINTLNVSGKTALGVDNTDYIWARGLFRALQGIRTVSLTGMSGDAYVNIMDTFSFGRDSGTGALLVPDVNNYYDIGASNYMWKKGFFTNITSNNITASSMLGIREQAFSPYVLVINGSTLHRGELIMQNTTARLNDTNVQGKLSVGVRGTTNSMVEIAQNTSHTALYVTGTTTGANGGTVTAPAKKGVDINPTISLQANTLSTVSAGLAGTATAQLSGVTQHDNYISIGTQFEGRFLNAMGTWNSSVNNSVIGAVLSTYTSSPIGSIGSNMNYIGGYFPTATVIGSITGTTKKLSWIAQEGGMMPVNQKLFFDGFYEPSQKLEYGDSYIQYNSTNQEMQLVVDNTYAVNISRNTTGIRGNLNVDGNITGNTIYGEMYYHNDSTMTLDFAVGSTFYPLFCNESIVNGFRLESSGDYIYNISAIKGGVYLINYAASGSGQNNHIYHLTVFINETREDQCEIHKKMTAGGDVVTMTGTCIVRLKANDDVALRIADMTGTGTGEYYSSNLNLIRVGD